MSTIELIEVESKQLINSRIENFFYKFQTLNTFLCMYILLFGLACNAEIGTVI